MITRENLKREIDTLSEDQFQVMVDLLILLKNAQHTSHSKSGSAKGVRIKAKIDRKTVF